MQAFQPAGPASAHQAPNAQPAKSSQGDTDADADNARRHWLWLDHAVVALSIVVLLSVIAYMLVYGEVVMPQLDSLDLVAVHSLQP